VVRPVSRVLTVVGSGTPGGITGAERMAWRTSAALAERGHPVGVLAEGAMPDGVGGRIRVFRSAGELSSARWVPDVVHAYDFAAPGYARLARDLADRYGAWLVATPASAPATWPEPALGRELAARTELLFVLSDAEAAVLRPAGVDPARLRTVPQAADLVGTPDGAVFRSRYGLAGPIVLFLGRRIPSKGHGLLLRATPLIWKRCPDALVVFAGPAADLDAVPLRKLLPDPRIADLGNLPDVAKHDALAACDLVCLPSAADVFPLVFAEAWSCGKPVVSGRFEGAESVVRHGVDGLVADLDAESVAGAVTRLLLDAELRTALGTAGADRARRTLGWDEVATAVERGYAELAEEQGGGMK
jgi:glycosyltransferase involved in cell wall biosynthesis